MKRIITSVMLAVSLLTVPVATTGCKTTDVEIAYKSLRGVAVTVDNTMRAYAELVAKGQVMPADQKAVRKIYEDYQRAMLVAIMAAKLDYSSPAPADVLDLSYKIVDAVKGLL